MATWYTVRHTLSHKHNIEHDRLNIRTLQCNIRSLQHNRLDPNYAYEIIKNNKILYEMWHNSSSHEHNIEHNRLFFEYCSKVK